MRLQPGACGVGVGDAFPVVADRARAQRALAAGAARAIAVGQQYDEAALGKALAPVPIARAEYTRGVAQAGAIVQADHRRKRALPVGAEQHRLEPDAAVFLRNLDGLGIARGQRGAGRAENGGRGY